MPKTDPPPPKVLSTVHDTDGHTIERLPGNVLRIFRTDHSRPVTHDEAKAVSEWFWKHVAKPHDPITNPTDPEGK